MPRRTSLQGTWPQVKASKQKIAKEIHFPHMQAYRHTHMAQHYIKARLWCLVGWLFDATRVLFPNQFYFCPFDFFRRRCESGVNEFSENLAAQVFSSSIEKVKGFLFLDKICRTRNLFRDHLATSGLKWGKWRMEQILWMNILLWNVLARCCIKLSFMLHYC